VKFISLIIFIFSYFPSTTIQYNIPQSEFDLLIVFDVVKYEIDYYLTINLLIKPGRNKNGKGYFNYNRTKLFCFCATNIFE